MVLVAMHEYNPADSYVTTRVLLAMLEGVEVSLAKYIPRRSRETVGVGVPLPSHRSSTELPITARKVKVSVTG